MEKIKVPYAIKVEKLLIEDEEIMPIVTALPYLIQFSKPDDIQENIYDAERQLTLAISDSCTFSNGTGGGEGTGSKRDD